MKPGETDNLNNKMNVRERLITPKCPEQPLIRLIENKDIGCYEATFGVKLIGVSYTGKRDEKPDNRAYEMKVAKEGRKEEKENARHMTTGTAISL